MPNKLKTYPGHCDKCNAELGSASGNVVKGQVYCNKCYKEMRGPRDTIPMNCYYYDLNKEKKDGKSTN